jgi:cytochrome c oxidase assembly protein subunit 15
MVANRSPASTAPALTAATPVPTTPSAPAATPFDGEVNFPLATQRSGPPAQTDPAAATRTLRRSFVLVLHHLLVALVALVAIGGATRVMEAGLACPDWPLCYGSLLPGRQMNLQVFLEWFHRLDAFLVGVVLLVLAGASLRYRRLLPAGFPLAALLALGLVAGQGLLGALTVSRLLAAATVTAHLATALLLVALVSAMARSLASGEPGAQQLPLPLWWRFSALVALTGVLGQCLAGAAMASQWAADRCLAAGEACRWLALHRSAAIPAALLSTLPALAALALPPGSRVPRRLALAAVALVLVQVALGIATLRAQLSEPLLTVAHQVVAALLVAVLAAAAASDLPLSQEVNRG